MGAAHRDGKGSAGVAFAVTCAIGMLHGFGFSFMLHEILRVDAPDIWESLLAFNLGVEIAQLLVVAAAWPAFILARRLGTRPWNAARAFVAGGCICVAAWWTVERAATGLGAA